MFIRKTLASVYFNFRINFFYVLVIKKNKVFNIGDYKVSNIVIYSKILGEKVVSSKVMKKYDKLIKYLTELLVAMREALNQIEKFRLEIKIKYRKILKKKELELMSKQLVKLQKIANERLIEIHNSYLELLNNKISK